MLQGMAEVVYTSNSPVEGVRRDPCPPTPGLHERIALLDVANILITQGEAGTDVVFLSDCKSVLENFLSPAKDNTSRKLYTALSNLSQKCNVALQWIPSHCEIKGNEKADRFSRQEASLHSSSTLSPSQRREHSQRASSNRYRNNNGTMPKRIPA